MSSNVGLSTPRGSGTSGYVQKNWAFMKPRAAGYGAPYPPVSRTEHEKEGGGGGFRQRQPDKKILEHDRRREVEVRVLEERERIEELNEKIEEGEEEGKVLTEEEIEERCEELRTKLLKELEREEQEGEGPGGGGGGGGKARGKGKKDLKSYQVHELAEAKIEESERLRKALGITEDKETGEISSSRDRDYRGGRRYKDWD